MKIIIAPDSFKGSMTALEVAHAMEIGVHRVWPDADVEKIPLADGGEGTVDALVRATGGRIIPLDVTGPLGEGVPSFFGITGDGKTAIIESAAAAGLTLIPEHRRNPLTATSQGIGELILAAMDHGCRKIIVGLGGSGTNDGGVGMIRALGGRFLDADGQVLPPGGAALKDLAKIDITHLDARIKETRFIVACDVNNPLIGPEGASAVYGPQKGASMDDIPVLDMALARYAQVIYEQLGKDVALIPGAGAAGGLGGGFIAFTDAILASGIDIVLQAVEFKRRLQDADLVLTGEGMLDRQTLSGKTAMGVLRLAREQGVPTVAIGGGIMPEDVTVLHDHGFAAVVSCTSRPVSLDEAIVESPYTVSLTAQSVCRLLMLGGQINKLHEPS